MAVPAVSLPSIEALNATWKRGHAFPPAIEAFYEERTASHRNRNFRMVILPALLIYNAFLIADYFLVPETFVLSVILHFCVVTPIILAAAFLYPRVQTAWVRDAVAAAVPLSMILQIMTVFLVDAGAAAEHYQYLAIPVIIYMNLNQRSGYRAALVSTIALVVAYLAFLWAAPTSLVAQMVGTGLGVSAGFLSLMANRRMDHDMRRAFLLRVQERLQRENAEQVAKIDALTGLPNRRALEEEVKRVWTGQEDGDVVVAVIMVDIDCFKLFNDRYGHAAGDTCLKRIANILASEVFAAGLLAVRMGGEEFILFLPGKSLSAARELAERVRRRIEDLGIPHEDSDVARNVTASFGVCAGPVSVHSFDELVNGADAALYAAKRSGRNQVWPLQGRSGSRLAPKRATGTTRMMTH